MATATALQTLRVFVTAQRAPAADESEDQPELAEAEQPGDRATVRNQGDHRSERRAHLVAEEDPARQLANRAPVSSITYTS